ncbi:MAG: methionine--tRNA ligase subunit beta, partial [Syntrophomonadaceae bacterium]|nr:methionine--tRNA ligase subunit beta [Syntrophomonadaceae bacterium]
ITRYFEGAIPAPGVLESVDNDLMKTAQLVYRDASEKLEKLDFAGYIISSLKLVSRANKYIDETEPWLLAKDENKKERLATVMYNLAESIRIAIILLSPAMPTILERANRQIGVFGDISRVTWDEAGQWGLCPAGSKVKKEAALFPRIDLKTLETTENVQQDKKEAVKPELKASEGPDEKYISIDDFARMDLRIAEVIACEKMEKADKLLILRLKVGAEERTVVSGIAKHYSPQELIGKKLVLLANLKPTKLRGVMSQGMILAASGGEELEVLMLDKDIPSGSQVR